MKTSELNGSALDWAVTRANFEINYQTVWEQDKDTCEYSSDWAQAGPIIERERIEITWHGDHWAAMWWADNSSMVKNVAHKFKHNRRHSGPSPLVAAMRCFVATKLGEEVDIPEGLA